MSKWGLASEGASPKLSGDSNRPNYPGYGLSLTRRATPTPHANHKSRLSPTGYRFKVSTTLCLGSMNFPECLTEPRGPFYFLDSWVIVKGCSLGTARWKGRREQGVGEVKEHPCLSRPTLSPISTCAFTSPEGFDSCSLGVLWWLHYIGTND